MSAERQGLTLSAPLEAMAIGEEEYDAPCLRVCSGLRVKWLELGVLLVGLWEWRRGRPWPALAALAPLIR